jgi:hypothetical protein
MTALGGYDLIPIRAIIHAAEMIDIHMSNRSVFASSLAAAVLNNVLNSV